MAQRTVVVLTDDVDGGDAVETIAFGLDGNDYEIDLNDKHASELRDAIGHWVEYSRRVKGGKSTRKVKVPTSSGGTNGKVHVKASPRLIRDWARTNGHDVPDRGRVPQAVVDAFEAAQ